VKAGQEPAREDEMSKLKEWTLIAMVALTGAVSLGSDCDFTLTGDEDGLQFDFDEDDDDDFFEDLEDLFD
jgi:hypothetical protein